MAGVPHLVDPPTWDRAGWLAMVFLAPQGAPIGLGFAFSGDPNAAQSIFSTWRTTLGSKDVHGLLRVAIIKGNRPGPGYFVHLSVFHERAVWLAANSPDGVVDIDMRALTGDVARWFPQSNPAPLEQFIQRYTTEGECQLVPVMYADGAIEPMYSMGMLTSNILLRSLTDITSPDDPDFPLTR